LSDLGITQRRSEITDLVIIGNSLTGLVAAISAAEKGMSVRLLGEGTGLIHLSSGCIDILGSMPGKEESVTNPMESLPKFLELVPRHPYGVIGQSLLQKSFDLFQDITHVCGLNYHGNYGENRYFLTAAGTLKQSCYYPASFHTPSIEEIKAIRFLAIDNIGGFFPALATALCNKMFPDLPVDFHEVNTFSEVGKRMTSLALSFKLQDMDNREAFVQSISPYCESGFALGIPAIFSPLTATEIIQRIRKLYGCFLFEMATIPPSLPGYHLGKSLLEYAVSLGVEPFMGSRVTCFHRQGRRVTDVTIERPGRDIKVRAQNFLLATGSLLGGGLKISGKQIREPLFELPVEAPEQSEWFAQRFFQSRHPIRRSGIRVNEELRPLSSDDEMIYDNVQVAGTILAGADIIAERSGGGVCIGSAYKAIECLKGMV